MVKNINTSTNFSSSKFLARLIKKIRITNYLTQTQFGELFQPSVTQSTVARWEKGEQMPDKIHFPKIAYFLDFTLEELQELLEDPVTNLECLHIEKKTLTPNKNHLKILKQGVKSWNKWRDKNPNIIPDLAGVKLSYFDLDGINLARADLRRVNLSHGSFRNSFFQNADLSGANLNKLQLLSSCLNSANLSNASLRFTGFNKAELVEVDLQKTSSEEVSFYSANLRKANLSNANLLKIDLREANLNQASLEKARISESLVYGASFWQTNLKEMKLENVYISADGKKGLPIDDLALAQITYLERHNPSVFQKFLEKYLESGLATNESEQRSLEPEIHLDGDCFLIQVRPDFRDGGAYFRFTELQNS